MIHSLGTDGTLKSTTLEGRFRELVSRLEEIEKNTETINTKGADLIKSSSTTAEAELFRGECQCYLMFSDSNSLSYPEIYTGAAYAPGTGSEAVNYNHALAEVALAIYKAEGNRTNNPNQLDRKLTGLGIAFNEQILNSPATHNAILSFSFAIPITTTTTADGTLITAKEFLVNG